MKYDFDKVVNRKGTYSTQWDYIEDRFGKADLLPFSISDTDFEVPSIVMDDLRTCLEHKIFGYTRWNHDDFKLSIVHHFKKRMNTDIEKDWIAYSPSVIYSISVLLRLLSKAQDRVLVFDPMYDAFINVIEKNNRTMVPCALQHDNDNAIDWVDFENKVKDCRIFLLCSPHNPTGKVFSNEEYGRMIALCKQYDVYIISDEIHSDIVLHGNQHKPLLSYYHPYAKMMIVSSASKTFNTPALGGSYVILPDKKIYEQFMVQTRQKDFVNSANIMGMIALMSSYEKAHDYIDELILYIEGNMKLIEDFMKTEFPDVKFHCPQATYLAWIDMRSVPFTSNQIQKALVDVGGVGIMNGEVYGENGKGFLRLNAGCPKAKLMEGLQRFKHALQSLYEVDRC